nr:uncharacterized protein LOC113809882 [Penaeus vannamei]
MANQNPDLARAFPTSNVQGHHRTLARNGRLPYQQQIRLKKIAHRRKRKRVEEVRGTIQIATLNIGSLTGRGQEIVDLMNRRRINIICVQETKWKGCKAREIGNGFKLFYNGSDGKRNGVDLREIPESQRLWIGGDFNGHCGSNNRGKEDTIGIYGVGVSNVAGDQLVDFAMSDSLQINNTFFKKAERTG